MSRAGRATRSEAGCALFSTVLGRCGVAWDGQGIVAVALPEAGDETLRERLRKRLGPVPEKSPTPTVQSAIDGLTAHLDGRTSDLSGIVLSNDDLTPFSRRLQEALRKVGPGRTVTYGELARLAGSPGAARAVGRFVASNRWPVIVPCHRVVATNGLGGFSAGGGVAMKRRLLEIEGVLIPFFAGP